MNWKLWVIFVVSQITGICLALYSSRFEVGTGGIRELLWIPATLVLLPGILCGYVVNVLRLKIFDLGGGIAFYAIAVLLNAASWYVVISLVRKRRVAQA